MAVAALELLAGARAGRGVDAGLQAQCMDEPGQCRHVGEVLVRKDPAVGVAHLAHNRIEVESGAWSLFVLVDALLDVFGGDAHPAIVDADIRIPDIGHAAGHHGFGGRADFGVGDEMVVGIPVVPAHRRSQGEFVADDECQLALVLAVVVLRVERSRHGDPRLRARGR